MKVLIDLQHPAHLHFFKNLIARLHSEGHTVQVTGRRKDILEELAYRYDLDIEFFGTPKKGILNLACEMIYRQYRLLGIIKRFKPDIMLAIAGTYISTLGYILRIPVYVFYDTEHAAISNLLSYPFASCIYIPQCYRKPIRWRHVRYNGYHELAYLHPNVFRPDGSILSEAGLRHDERFVIVRFVAWGAVHDIGLEGFDRTNKLRAVEALSQHARVLISSEGNLPRELEPYCLRIDAARIHDLMAYASLVFGESATMCSEGAVLGVPGIYVDPVGRGYTDEQEREYGLVFNFKPSEQDAAIQKGIEILHTTSREKWREKALAMVQQKIDVSEMLYQIATSRLRMSVGSGRTRREKRPYEAKRAK